MKEQTNQDNYPVEQPSSSESALLRDLQEEVTAETAPLLQFITRHAALIAGTVIVFLLVLAVSGILQWYNGSQVTKGREELARICEGQKSQDKIDALSALHDNVPEAMRVPVLLELAQAAFELGQGDRAAEAYAKAAASDSGAIGIIAVFGEAGSKLKSGKNEEALALLQGLSNRLTTVSQSATLRQMIAEVAEKAGKNELAAMTWTSLAKEAEGMEKAYFQSRADAFAPASNK